MLMSESTRRVLLQGMIQGSGVRPALARFAAARGWSGSARNTPEGVEFLIRGPLPSDEELRSTIADALPTSTGMEHIQIELFRGHVNDGFQIIDSITSGVLTTRIPRDRAVCRDCLRELHDPGNRRYRYPFITCAVCGPRYSILLALPFDRERTTMRAFPMCGECRREYADPGNRRFHAQTISCPVCGPRLWITHGRQTLHDSVRSPWEIAAEGLRQGKIVALRGIGGYQLLADAASPEAVQRLRQRKRRLAKPFAVLCRHLTQARRLAELNDEELVQLESAANPIVLVRQRLPKIVAGGVNPGLKDIGLMLPTTALHDLLLAAVDTPLVCTSGNLEGEPLSFKIEAAERDLSGIADLFLHHDRDISQPTDDSVLRVMAHRPVTFRAARGIAPQPLELPSTEGKVYLACGGHQKSAIAWHNGAHGLLGPHVGDLETVAGRDRWDEQRNRLSRLINDDRDLNKTVLACDPHPAYFATQWAVGRNESPQNVWHHHAHCVTGMLEHGWRDRDVLGVVWDGTGLGPDGVIWGGEFLRATATTFDRVAHLRPFRLPGGEAAMTDVRRTALSILSQLEELSPADIPGMLRVNTQQIGRRLAMLTPTYSPLTTSCGRLFDAAACLIVQQMSAEYEGHAAMCLEAVCDLSVTDAYEFAMDGHTPTQIDWRPVFRSIVSDRSRNVPCGVMAMKFHRGLVQMILDVVQQFPELPVVFGGGVFQNRVLVELVADNWPAGREPPGLPGVLPPNDGGLAAGQLASAVMSALNKEKTDVPGSARPRGGLDRPRLAVGCGRH